MTQSKYDLNRTVLLVMDMQEHYLVDLPEEVRERVVVENVEMLKTASRLGIPSLGLVQREGGALPRELYDPLHKSWGIISRDARSGFRECRGSYTALDFLLRQNSKTIPLISGLNTSVDIRETIIEGLSRGFEFIVPGNVIAEPEMYSYLNTEKQLMKLPGVHYTDSWRRVLKN